MPVVTLYRHGGKAGVPGSMSTHTRAKRGTVGGWSSAAARRNTEFLMGVDESRLDGSGWAFTLTLRHCPPTSDDWHRLRKAWIMRLARAGMLRLHWVTEWQRRGVPHLHGAVWFPLGHDGLHWRAVDAWLDLAGKYGAGDRGQDVRPITGAIGWFQYLAKHAARGVRHYQRCPENVPPEWRSRTGRVWGYWGDWPKGAPLRVELEGEHGDGGFFAYRRLVRGWRVADARKAGDRRRLILARRMLQASDPVLCRLRGVHEWIPQEHNLRLLANLYARGYRVTS
jgi:hypothetical protein